MAPTNRVNFSVRELETRLDLGPVSCLDEEGENLVGLVSNLVGSPVGPQAGAEVRLDEDDEARQARRANARFRGSQEEDLAIDRFTSHP